MTSKNFEKLIDYITQKSTVDKEEILRKIKAKKAKLSGLISDEGAAQIVAAELGISFEKQEFKLSELMVGMRRVYTKGKVLEIFPVRSYQKKEHQGEVASFTIADNTGNIRVVLWDTNHIELVKNNTIKENSVVSIRGADVKGNLFKELHLNSTSEIELSDEKIENIVIKKEGLLKKSIKNLGNNDRANVRASILQIYNPTFFSVCPECNMKVNFEEGKATCLKHGAVMPQKRAIINLILDDGSENIRSSLFSENIKQLMEMENVEDLSNPDMFLKKKEELLGKEFIFSGRTRENIMFNRKEFTVSNIEEVNEDEIIEELTLETK